MAMCIACGSEVGTDHNPNCPFVKISQQKFGSTKVGASKNQLNDIELEAREIVRGGDRETSYGHPRNDLERTAKIWSGILSAEVTPEQVALCMIGLKMSRLVQTPHHHDSMVDIIGYAICYDRLEEPVNEDISLE